MTKKKKTAHKSTSKSRKSKKPSLFKNMIKWGFVGALWTGIFLALLIVWYAGELPNITERATFEHKSSITIKAADGSTLARYGDIRGESVGIEDLPSHLIYAVLATEDRRFYQHFGIDLLGLARAVVVNLQAGHTVQGGSTITQQLAKNLFLSHERTLKRKIQEAMLALWLESELTKDEILSAYLNRVYLGAGAYGVDAAARLYFNRPVQDLTIRQSALLAGLLKAPSRYSPRNDPELAEQRTNVVLRAMADAGFILNAEADELVATTQTAPAASVVEASSKRYFTDWILEQADDLIGTPNENLIIETTLDPHIQTAAQKALTSTILAYDADHDLSQGAVVVMQPNGAVRGMVGGYNYAESQFNRVTQAYRQPGSAFKPILYLTALEKSWDADSQILDAPLENGEYRPQNFNEEYLGKIDLQTALAHSSNTAALRLMKDIGPKAVIDTARKLGIRAELTRDLSLALGTSSISPLELTAAYAAIANGGFLVQPFGITKITGEDGELYYERPRRQKTERVIEKDIARELAKMMERVLEDGTGRQARLPYPASGKTGTSQDSRDAWFVGFTDELVTGVWMGNDDNSPMSHVGGGGLPALIWKDVMIAGRGRHNAFSGTDFITNTFEDLLSRITSGPSVETKSPGGGYNR